MIKVKALFFFLFVLIGAYGYSQKYSFEHNYSIEGFITEINGVNLNNVHVVNLNQNTGTISNYEGLFKIPAAFQDSIRFSCIGFLPKTIILQNVSDSPIIPFHVTLLADTLQLQEVIIYSWPANAEALKREVLAMDEEENKIPDLKLNEIKTRKNGDTYYQKSNILGMMDPGITYTINGPITALYNRFSKSGRSINKYNELVNEDHKTKIVASRYNVEVVKRITTFKSDKDIQDFMIFCNLSVDFIFKSTEYELIQAIQDCFLAYTDKQ